MSVQPLRKGLITDEQLVRRAQAGRREAFNELISRHESRAALAAYQVLGNTHDTLEVCQEAYVRAYRRLRTLADPCSFGAWLLRIVTNLALNHRRTRALRRSAENCRCTCQPHDQRPLLRGALLAQWPGALLAAEELRAHIAAELAALPERQRAALILFSIEGVPQRRVARLLGCSVEAVKWHVFQARQKMRARLGDCLLTK